MPTKDKKPVVAREYEATLDNKRRFTVRGSKFTRYHVREFSDGTIQLEPRVLVHPDTLRRMAEDLENFHNGNVSEPVNEELARLARELGVE